MPIDGLLLLGFGGPTPGCCGRRAHCPKTPGCEAECFVAGILGDNPARMGRIDEVVHHYQAVGGGFSPYNALTFAQGAALEAELARRGRAIPVTCGFRHWTPWAKDGLVALRDRGCKAIGLLVMAPHQSSVSWDWYLKHAAEAVESLGAGAPAIAGVVAPWWEAPGHLDAVADQVRKATAGWSAERLAAAEVVFTAHAIPQPVEATSPYRRQMEATAAAVAQRLGLARHRVAFQSAPSDSRIPWSSPDILTVVEEAAQRGVKDLVVQAAGFLVDHTEVLFDLDVETAEACAKAGITYTRAPCVHDHPAFIGALADAVIRL